MNGPCAPYKRSLENKHKNSNKRQWQPNEEYYEHQHKKHKSNKTEIGYKSNNDILILLKSKLERILINNNTKHLNTIIEDIQPYGSRVSGTYTDDSDVDFHISYTSNVPIKNVILSFVKSLRNSCAFNNIIPIVHAKIPIIKCVCKDTGIDCDISFNNISAVHNSHLLNHVISMDSRVKPVLMKLKIWAKNIGLICTNGFSSYSFYWLGLFCMQVMGILPPICDLQKPIPELLVGNWNCAFSKEQITIITKNLKSLSVIDILNAIYIYYSDFNFETFVISPFIGRPIPKKDFENIEQLPEELLRYKQFHKENKDHEKLLFLRNTKFCMYVQDPFQHNINITARVNSKMFEKFVKSCAALKAKEIKSKTFVNQ